MQLPQFRWKNTIFILITTALLAGCVAAPKPDVSNPIRTVAILPFANQSNNIDGPNIIRKKLRKQLKAKFYKVIPLKEIDQILADELGITLGDQLAEVDFAEIRQKIDADGFIFGDVSYFDQTISGVVNTNRVAAKLHMIQASNNRQVWESNIGIKSQESAGGIGALASLASEISDATDETIQWITIETENNRDDSLLGGLARGLIKSAVASAFDATLDVETTHFVNHSTQTLRQGPGY